MGSTDKASLNWEKFQNVIAGGLRDSADIHHGVNPSDKTQLWDVPIATASDLDDAVESAQKAFKTWSKTSWKERTSLLAQVAEELLKHREEMGRLVMLEAGKPVRTLFNHTLSQCSSFKISF